MFYDRLLPVTYDHRPSMLADLEHRGRTEIGALNGKVVEMAARLGLERGDESHDNGVDPRPRARLAPPPKEHR